MSLMEQADQIRTQLGYPAELPLSQIIDRAEADLGLGKQSGQLNMVERTELVMRTLGLSVAPAAGSTVAAGSVPVVEGSVVTGTVAPVPAVMAGAAAGPPYGTPVVEVAPIVTSATPVAGQLLGTFTFGSCDNSAFDTGGVLYALGTDFGRSSYTNPADSGKVRLDWSADAANYYSTNGGHKQGDATQAARVICANRHPGANATMWSRGSPGAWFLIDLLSVELMPTHFAYRNDYGAAQDLPSACQPPTAPTAPIEPSLQANPPSSRVRRRRQPSALLRAAGIQRRPDLDHDQQPLRRGLERQAGEVVAGAQRWQRRAVLPRATHPQQGHAQPSLLLGHRVLRPRA